MKLVNKLADRVLDRLAPRGEAQAADCWIQPCTQPNEPCMRRCCKGQGCAPMCFC